MLGTVGFAAYPPRLCVLFFSGKTQGGQPCCLLLARCSFLVNQNGCRFTDGGKTDFKLLLSAHIAILIAFSNLNDCLCHANITEKARRLEVRRRASPSRGMERGGLGTPAIP